MKVKKRKVMLSLAFVGLLILEAISYANAKFWGWQTTGTTDWADGMCAYRGTFRVHYIFWISGEEEGTTSTTGCIDY